MWCSLYQVPRGMGSACGTGNDKCVQNFVSKTPLEISKSRDRMWQNNIGNYVGNMSTGMALSV